MLVTWDIIKTFVTARALSIQYLDLGDSYFIKAFDGAFELSCTLNKDDSNISAITDFETNFKPLGNKPLFSYFNQPFAAKVLPNGKKLYKREHGIRETLVIGSNVILFTIPYPWVKITGFEVNFLPSVEARREAREPDDLR